MLDADLFVLPDFFREHYEVAMAKWDARSCQYRILREPSARVPACDASSNPWPDTFGFGFDGGEGDAAEQWQSQVQSSLPVLQPMAAPVAIDTKAQKDILQWAEGINAPTKPSSKASASAWESQLQEQPQVESPAPAPSAFMSAWANRKRRPELIEAEQQAMRANEKQVQSQTEERHGSTLDLRHRQRQQQNDNAPPALLIDLSENTPTEERRGEHDLPIHAQGSFLPLQTPNRPVPASEETSQPEPPPLIDFSEDPPTEEQPKFQPETKLKGGRSRTSDRPSENTETSPTNSSAAQGLSSLQMSMDQILSLAVARHGCSAIHVELFVGKIYVAAKSVPRHLRCLPRRPAPHFSREEWSSVFASPMGKTPGAKVAFSKRLTNSWKEARFLSELQDHTPNGVVDVFRPTTTPEKQRYRIHCRNERDGSEAFIDIVDQEENAWVVAAVQTPLGSTRIYFPKRNWDACVFVGGYVPLTAAQAAAFESTAKTVQIMPRAEDEEPGKLYGRTPDSDVKVLTVETRLERTFRSQVHNTDTFLNVTQVRRHMLEQRADGTFMAHAAAEADMVHAGLLWFEVSLRSRKLNRALTAANAREGGTVTHPQVVDAKSVADSSLTKLWHFGQFLVMHADAVGSRSRWLQADEGATQPSQNQTGIL